ncbi:PseG/SpsG family protein [Tuwongella immobilis]|uniref:Pseudaminic acid biosynthesis-associated protein: Marine sediment metagenome DNA, contig: S01H1_S21519 n=1 Tax=Tuwongella immobilis TaxID=692036 RepID=A0A6C2YGR8_9BACT
MNRTPILFRCDANSDLGYESFYQCLTLASAMQRRRRGTYLMSRLDPFPLFASIQRGGNEAIQAETVAGSPDDCNETIREIRRLNAAAVVVAIPGVTEGYLKELASTGTMVVTLDSEASICNPSRLVINPLLGPSAKAYRIQRGTQMLLGSRYPLVRSVFRRQRPIRAIDPVQPFRALIAMGDNDKTQSLIRTKELLGTTRIDKISVAVRSHHPQLEELKALAAEHGTRLEILTETAELSTRLPRAHFAVTSGDGWSLEMACVGIPQFILAQAPHHVLNAARLDEEGAATYLGEAAHVPATALRHSVQLLLSDPLERFGMSRCARQLIDGRGPDRLVNGIEILLHTAPPVQPVLRIAA